MSTERNMLLPEEYQIKLAVELQKEGLFGIFDNPDQVITLKSGRLSPHYLDIRKGISNFNMRQLVAETMVKLANIRAGTDFSDELEEVYDHVAGTPEAMTSYAASIADLSRMSLLQPRVATGKATGNKTPILGRYEPHGKVAAFDDVVTEGQSKIDTIDSFTQAGLEVTDYFVVLDREEGGAPRVTEVTGIEITPALGVSSLVKMLRADRRISITQFDNVARYLDQYGEPHAKAELESAP